MSFRDIPAFCINLDHRTDRWALATEEFAKLDWPVERVSGCFYTAETMYGINGRHAGALDSHRKVWRTIIERNIPVAAVFEDDVVFSSDFASVFEKATAVLPVDWKLWWLHSSRARCRRVNDYVCRILSTGWGAHGYLIKKQACQELLDLRHIDNIDTVLSLRYMRAGQAVYGMPMQKALCFQRGNSDSDIPATCQAKFWREQREKYCR